MAESNVIRTGVEVEEKTFIWEIKNFLDVRKLAVLINAQNFEFKAGDSIGLSSKWRVDLHYSERTNPDWIGIYLSVLQKPKAAPKHLIGQLTFQTLKKDGTVYNQSIGKPHDWNSNNSRGWGLSDLLTKRGVVPLVNGKLIIRILFRFFSTPISVNHEPSVQEMLEQFHEDSKARTCEDLAHLVRLPLAYNGIEIISSDGKQFQARKEVLEASSPVFETMLRSDMREKAENKIELKDMSSQTVEVLLHFFYTGELLPQWKEQKILPELTNAAAGYELLELLVFLDTVLGKVCVNDNVLELLNLADKLDLKAAEEGLMEFVRLKGIASKTSFLRMTSAVHSQEDDD